jgi:predicted AlkP superfamily pyrophosphatase or phosphodiesterase
VFSIDGFPAYTWAQPDLVVPNLRKLAAEGASAQAMIVTTPASTWSSHTSMITGVSPRRHGVMFNGQVVRRGPKLPPKVEQWNDKVGFVLAPTLYDIAHAAGLTIAESDWVAITRAPTVTWSFPEIPSPQGVVEREMIAAGLLTEEQIGWMQHRPGRKSMVWHDAMWTKAACFMFERHQPNLLLVHPLTTDSNHHHYGPGSEGGLAALSLVDRLVGDVVATVERAGLRDRTTFIIMTDHGFKRIDKFIHANVALNDAGLLRVAGLDIVAGDAVVLSMGGTALAFVSDPARRAELVPRLRELLIGLEGVARVLDGSEGPAFGLPTPAENDLMGDLLLIARDGYGFHDSAVGDRAVAPVVNYAATHGYPASDPDMNGIFIASGAHIMKGVVLPTVHNRDLGPTIARILGLEMPNVEGRVLEEILVGE